MKKNIYIVLFAVISATGLTSNIFIVNKEIGEYEVVDVNNKEIIPIKFAKLYACFYAAKKNQPLYANKFKRNAEIYDTCQ